MPIYEYVCQRCGHQFELLVRRETVPICASCGAVELERVFSLPTVKSANTEALAMRAAQRRDQAQATERTIEQVKYERSHND